jgi:hypothetical protein
MRTRAIVLLLILLFSITFLFAENGKKEISVKDFWDALSGTWVNTKFPGKLRWFEQKLIVYPDGKFEYYPLITDKNPSRQGYYLIITEAWIDSEGVMWGKSRGVMRYQLNKISESGNTWEFCECTDKYPTNMDNHPYIIRYRQPEPSVLP